MRPALPSATGAALTGIAALVLLCAGLGFWAMTARLTGAVIAQGSLQVAQSRQVVQHPQGGVVAEVLVQEDDLVSAGQLLLRLDDGDIGAELAAVEAALFDGLARRSRLEAERDDAATPDFGPLLAVAGADAAPLIALQSDLFASRLAEARRGAQLLALRRGYFADQIAGLRAQQIAIDTQIALLSDNLAMQQDLHDRGLVATAAVQTLQRQLAAVTGQAGALTAAIAETQGRMSEVDLALAQAATERQRSALAALQELDLQERQLRERWQFLQSRVAQLEIRAPVSGQVFAMQDIAPRAVISPAAPILYIVPQDRPLYVVARINPKDIARIYPGQPTRLRFAGAGLTDQHDVAGAVANISADVYPDSTTGASFYRVEIGFDPAEFPPTSTLSRPRPGTPVEAFFATGEATPLAYLTEPLIASFSRVFR